jgi:6-phosphogluconolactonase
LSAADRTLNVDGAHVLVLQDAEAVTQAAAELTIAGLSAAIDERGVAHLVLTGGSSAVALYALLPRDEWRGRLPDWTAVHLWWGDDRLVPVDHPDSNVGLAYRELLAWGAMTGQSGSGGLGTDVTAGVLSGLQIPPENIHAPPVAEALATTDPGTFAAEKYAAMINAGAPQAADGLPAFDVVLLGVGPDGHILSAFPGSTALASDAPVVAAVGPPEHVEPHLPRVTLTPRVLPAAGRIIVMATGSAKADVLARVLGLEKDPARWPAQRALLPNATWLIDEAAAANLAT